MPKKADRSAKKLIGMITNLWAQWLTQRDDVVIQGSLKTEFEWLGRVTDILLKASSPELGTFLIVHEFQLRYDKRMPRRLNAYAALAEEEYNLPVYPVVITILPPSANTVIADRYESTFLGLPAVRHFRVINLWEIDANIVFDQPLPALLPFVPVLRGGGNEATIRKALQQLRVHEELRDMETVLAFFSSMVLDSRLVQQIMRWDMAVLRESPWYQEIIEEGMARGLEQGIARGELRMLVLSLEQRLGALPADLPDKLALLTIDQIETLFLHALKVKTLEEFLENLPEQNSNGASHTNGADAVAC